MLARSNSAPHRRGVSRPLMRPRDGCDRFWPPFRRPSVRHSPFLQQYAVALTPQHSLNEPTLEDLLPHPVASLDGVELKTKVTEVRKETTDDE